MTRVIFEHRHILISIDLTAGGQEYLTITDRSRPTLQIGELLPNEAAEMATAIFQWITGLIPS